MCVFCVREVDTRQHHVVPKSKGGRLTEPTCADCESFIHRTFTHNQLRDIYNTVESIKINESYRRFHRWLLRQQPDARFATARHRERDPRRYR